MSAPVFTPSFAYILTLECNLGCHACDQAAPLAEPGFVSPQRVQRDLEALAPVLHTGALRITGGEPLLHPRLLEILRLARESGITDCLRLLTNGVLLHRAPLELWELVDDICVSLYPDVKLAQPLSAYAETAQRHGVIIRPIRQSSFLRSILNTRIESAQLVQTVFRQCRMANQWSCHAVHLGHYFKCTIAPQAGWRLARLGIAYDPRVDGVPIHDNPDLAVELERYLRDDRPLQACAFCLGTSAPRERHRALGRGEAEAWCQEDHDALIAATEARLATAGTATVVVGGTGDAGQLWTALETLSDQAGVDVDALVLGPELPELPEHWMLGVRHEVEAHGWAAVTANLAGSRCRMLCFMEPRHRLEWTFLQACAATFVAEPGTDWVLALPSSRVPHFEWNPEPADPVLLLAGPPPGPLVLRRSVFESVAGLDPELGCWPARVWDLVLGLVAGGRAGVTVRVPADQFCAGEPPVVTADDSRRVLRRHRAAFQEHLPHLLALVQDEAEGPDTELDRVCRQRDAAVAEAAALRASRSWRVTRPLRRALDLVLWIVQRVQPR